MSQLSGKMHWPTATIEEKKEKDKEKERVGKAFKNVAALEMWLCQPEK